MTANTNVDPKKFTEQANNKQCLSDCVREVMQAYFADLDGHDVTDLYELFLQQVEKPMLEVVMQKTRGNITKASAMLGLNRGTLRNRLRKYGID